MSRAPHVPRPRLSRALAVATISFVLACTPKPAPPPAPEPVPVPAGPLDAKGAAQQLATDLAKQLGTATISRTMVIDPFRDLATGQQTGASMRLESELGPALTAAIKGLTLLKFEANTASQARFIMTGTLASGDQPSNYVLTAALTDRQTGLVVAQSAARFVETGLDATPTRFFTESPTLVRDRSDEGYRKTTETPAGQLADALYVSQVPTSALLAEALDAYNGERWEAALAAYTAASQRSDGQQLRTFNGMYLASVRLGRAPSAEEAFGNIAKLGLSTNNFAVKMLFRAGSTEFLPGREYAGIYPMWVRQIARATQATGSCLSIVGHTSRSGSESVNDRLSIQRAEAVKRLLEAEVRGLAPKLRATGVGYRENIIGTGTDDTRDAVDRRVEFKVVNC